MYVQITMRMYMYDVRVYIRQILRVLSRLPPFFLPHFIYIVVVRLCALNIERQRVGYSNAHTFSLCIAFCFPGFFPLHHLENLPKKYFAFDEKLLY